MSDNCGNWPKWLTGAINVISGTLQAAVGATLVAAAPTTGGLSAIVGGALMINGAATIAAGAGQIINDVTGSNMLPEENAVRTTVRTVGSAIGGNKGEAIAAGIYDAADMAAGIYSANSGLKAGASVLQQAGKISKKVSISKVLNNPLDEFVTIGPKAGTVSQKIQEIQATGRYTVYVTQLPNGYYQIANGHHTVQALKSMGEETIKVFITK